MQDPLDYWDTAHANKQLHSYSLSQTLFAEEVNSIMPVHSSMLELGCGEGNDSIYFAEQGHAVLASDFSSTVIERDRQNFSNDNLQFKTQDIRQPFPYDDNTFDVLYARLSLHYFTDEVTRKIFAEIKRVLKSGGLICFMCKAVEDKLYGQGEYIEPDMFELEGHVRHFFSEAYIKDLLNSGGFGIKSIEKGHDVLYERESAFLKVIAKK